MEFEKRKYKRKEVVEMFDAFKLRYEELINDQKIKILELTKENSSLQQEIDKYKEKEELVFLTLSRAEKSALEIKELAKEEYNLELDRLRKFTKKLEKFFDKFKEDNIDKETIKKATDISQKLNKLSSGDVKYDIDQLEAMLPCEENVEFNPKEKISDYIVATEDSGFNINEVLHPGELELEKLCKELGLMDEEE